MKRPFKTIACPVLSVSLLTLAACGGGGGSGSGDSSGDGDVLSRLTTGYQLPSELSAVPTENGVSAAESRGFTAHVRALAPRAAVADLGSDSDYKKANTKRYVEERALEQFDIIEQVLNAVGQTNYADESVINNGPYTAMVTWMESEDGREIKTLEPWVVHSDMLVIDGRDVNRVRAWIEEPDYDNPGQTQVTKAEFKIYAAASVDASGNFLDYGDWDLNVSFGDDASDFFVASSRVSNGTTTVKVQESFIEQGASSSMKGVLVRSATNGYGKVQYPDWDACWGDGATADCSSSIPTKQAAYAYNADYLAVQANGDSVTYKDRNPANAVEMTHRYGLFYANADASATPAIEAGHAVERQKRFGFPLNFVDSNGMTHYAYYGAWQGRHELWGTQSPEGGSLLSAGDTVTKEAHGPNATPETYIVSPLFSGTFTKRTLVDGDLSDIQDIAVETWINKHYDLSYNGTAGYWQYCAGWIDWSQWPTPICMNHDNTQGEFQEFTDYASLVVSENDRKWVMAGRWDEATQQHIDLIYLASNPGNVTWSGAGFYPAQQGPEGRLVQVAGAERYVPADGNQMGVDIGGSIYIQYTGAGWVQKEVTGFDQQTWTPSFGANDQPFEPEVGREYYINNHGANFVVKRVGTSGVDANDYLVKIELQKAANPKNIGSILPAGTSYLRTPWRPEVRFRLVTDPASANFLKLVYASDDPGTPADESQTETVYTNGEWGMYAYNTNNQPLDADGNPVAVNEWGEPAGAVRPLQFNWEYSEGGWGSQQFLCSPDCSAAANYVTLSDPVQLSPLAVTNGAGVGKTLSLQYDGWMHGMPDLYPELSKNDFQMSPAIADKVINIPAGTLVTDTDGTEYYLKPLEVSVFLQVVNEVDIPVGSVPAIENGTATDLNTVPDFVDHGMGPMPTGTTILFSEGLPVSE